MDDADEAANSTDVVLKLVPARSWKEFPLGAEDVFVLSLVDNVLCVRDLVSASGLGNEAAVEVLRKLLKMGLVALDSAEPSESIGAPQPPKERKRRKSSKSIKKPERKLERSTGRLDLSPEMQRTVNRKFNETRFCTPQVFLGLDAEFTEQQVRTNFLKFSKMFHPDRYFNKQLGKYKSKLDTIYSHLTKCHDYLISEAQNRAMIVPKSLDRGSIDTDGAPTLDQSAEPENARVEQPTPAPKAVEPMRTDPKETERKHSTSSVVEPMQSAPRAVDQERPAAIALESRQSAAKAVDPAQPVARTSLEKSAPSPGVTSHKRPSTPRIVDKVVPRAKLPQRKAEFERQQSGKNPVATGDQFDYLKEREKPHSLQASFWKRAALKKKPPETGTPLPTESGSVDSPESDPLPRQRDQQSRDSQPIHIRDMRGLRLYEIAMAFYLNEDSDFADQFFRQASNQLSNHKHLVEAIGALAGQKK